MASGSSGLDKDLNEARKVAELPDDDKVVIGEPFRFAVGDAFPNSASEARGGGSSALRMVHRSVLHCTIGRACTKVHLQHQAYDESKVYITTGRSEVVAQSLDLGAISRISQNSVVVGTRALFQSGWFACRRV